MKLELKFLILLVFTVVSAAAMKAPSKPPVETRNAALRYWMAFAELRDTTVDATFGDIVNKTIAGEIPWNELKLGRILDENTESLSILRRATTLPECDWGLEYNLGARAIVPFVKDSERALGRLNTLDGLRRAAKGDTHGAVDAWLAGVQFSRHLAQGQSFLGNLVAMNALLPNLESLAREVRRGSFSSAQRQQIEVAVRALPVTGFDWGQAAWYEEVPLTITVRQMEESSNPAGYYQELMGEAAPRNFSVPNEADLNAFHEVMTQEQAALRLPPQIAAAKIVELQTSIANLHPFFQRTLPSLQRINEKRADIQAARNNLLQIVTSNRTD